MGNWIASQLVGDDMFLDYLKAKMVKGNYHSFENLKRYKNIIQWIVEGLGIETLYDYVRQYQVIRDFYELLCPVCAAEEDLDCWGKTKEQLKRQVLFELDWDEEVLKCPVCGFVRERLKYDRLVLCVGMRSGKSATAAMISSYTMMLWFALGGSLDKRYDLLPGQRFRIAMVCTSGAQTEKTVWGEFVSMMDNVRDADMRKILEGKMVNQLLGIGFGNVTKTNEVEWRFGNLEVLALHSNSGSLVGGTGLLSVLDEYSRFDLGDSKRSASEVFAALNNSLFTVRSKSKTALDDMFGRMIVVSAPFYLADRDPTVRLVKEGREKTLAYWMPSWEFNPFFRKEDIEEEYAYDAFRIERDFGANPDVGVSRFFEDVDRVLDCIEYGSGWEFKKVVKHFSGGVKFLTVEEVTGWSFGGRYSVHVDLGALHDSLSMAFAKREDGLIIVEGLLVLKPKGVEIWIDTALEILMMLKNKINFLKITYDNWNSLSAIQNLKREGLNVERRSVGETELTNLKRALYVKKVKIMDPGESAVDLIKEIKSLHWSNGKLSHVDILLSIAGAVANAEEIIEKTDIGYSVRSFRVGLW
uniref:Terminase large subunit gp17-like C-terminal domain-containing protein n=1 Tax=candidate division CPR3 bacterium TaxID=2268181 RepID=A0A7V3J9N3_UNCC3